MKALRFLLGALAAVLALLVAPGAAARDYYIAPFEMLEVYGTYPLSDGDVLRIDGSGNRAWARLNGTGRMRLRAVGPLEFVTEDGRLRLRFEPLPFTTEVVVQRS